MIGRNIIHDTSPFHEVDLLTCPLCHSRLRSCEKCNVTACSGHGCPGLQVVDFAECFEHSLIICHACLGSKDSDLEPEHTFVRCPSCNSWRCSSHMVWCPGSIIHPASSKELIELWRTSKLDSTAFVWSHPPILGPCESCICSGLANAWPVCEGSARFIPCAFHKLLPDFPICTCAYCPVLWVPVFAVSHSSRVLVVKECISGH